MDEKKLRVKINQIENDLELQFKRLTIVCKSKGQPKPKRPDCLPETPVRRGGGYVSPYRSGANPSPGARSNVSKGSGGYQYTPPSRKPLHQSNFGSSNRSDGSGSGVQSKVKTRFSPAGIPNGSLGAGSAKNNRMYSPNGQIRGESPKAYAAHTSHTRVRREPAVGSATRSNNISDTNSNNSATRRNKAAEYAQQV